MSDTTKTKPFLKYFPTKNIDKTAFHVCIRNNSDQFW